MTELKTMERDVLQIAKDLLMVGHVLEVQCLMQIPAGKPALTDLSRQMKTVMIITRLT